MNVKGLSVVLCLSMALPVTVATEDKILEFDTMVGVVRPFTGATNAIRGVPGGGSQTIIPIPLELLRALGVGR